MDKGRIRLVQTARDTGDRLTNKGELSFLKRPGSGSLVEIDRGTTFQRIEGFGGAFTEAGGWALSQVSREERTRVIRDYFDPNDGLGYNLCRTHINSCDFSLGSYSYDDVDGDVELRHFSIDRDRKYLLPFIKDALSLPGVQFRLIATPWSPPAWMKSNGDMNRGGKVLDRYKKTWARYYCRYVKEYAKEGVSIWGVTVQNEPEATQTWDSCCYTAEEERDFIRHYLGPTLEEEGLAHIKILAWDHNRDRLYQRAKVILSDPVAARYVWGMAFHWYSGDQFENVAKVSTEFPDKKLILTEACVECHGMGVGLHDWSIGERYAHNIIGDLNHGAAGWIDWNMVLDERGGPNHAGNFCNAPVIVDTKSGMVHRQSSYYYLGHFSKYIRPGAVRIQANTADRSLETTALQNPDGSVVVILLNTTNAERKATLKEKDMTADFTCPAHSILTLICN